MVAAVPATERRANGEVVPRPTLPEFAINNVLVASCNPTVEPLQTKPFVSGILGADTKLVTPVKVVFPIVVDAKVEEPETDKLPAVAVPEIFAVIVFEVVELEVVA